MLQFYCKRQTAHADAVAGLPVSLPGLCRMAEPVWSTRLQTFLTVLNFHPLSRVTGNDGLLTKTLLTKRLHQYSKLDVVKTRVLV